MFRRILKIFIGLAILLLILFISNLIVGLVKVNFPPALLGLILFTILLKCGIIKEEFVKDCSEIFLQNMGLFFVPLAVGIISHKGLLEKNFIPIIAVIFIVTFLTMITTALVVENMIKFIRLKRIKELHHD